MHLLTKESVENQLKELITKFEKFVPTYTAAKELGIHKSVFLRLGLNVEHINNSLGFFRTKLKPKSSIEEKEAVREHLITLYKALITRERKSISLYTFSKSISYHYSSLYRMNFDVRGIHSQCGIVYDVYDQTVNENCLVNKLKELIVEKGRYITRDEVASYFNVSGSLLSLKKIPVEQINSSMGFIRTNKSFEYLVGEWLSEIFSDSTIIFQKSFPDCKYKRKLTFDFFVEEQNLLVEVDGSSHHAKNSHWYSEENLKRDNAKNVYAEKKGIHLLRVRVSNKLTKQKVIDMLSGIPLKHSVGQPAAEPL